MANEIDKTIDYAYRLLAILWVIGALALAYSFTSQQDIDCCELAALHIEKT